MGPHELRALPNHGTCVGSSQLHVTAPRPLEKGLAPQQQRIGALGTVLRRAHGMQRAECSLGGGQSAW